MKRPFKYFVVCDKTKRVLYERNQPPMLIDLQTYEPATELGEGVKILKQTKTAYINTRYEAELRLYMRKNKHVQACINRL